MITPSISTPIGVNTSIYFTVPAGYYSYSWGGVVSGSTNQSSTVSFTTPGTYTATVFVCSDSTQECCGLYTYNFVVQNDCVGVSIATSYTNCSDITVTVTGGTGTKTYKVDGTYTSIGVTALPISGIFTINTSTIPPGVTDNITITVYVDDGSTICSKTATVNYTRCSTVTDITLTFIRQNPQDPCTGDGSLKLEWGGQQLLACQPSSYEMYYKYEVTNVPYGGSDTYGLSYNVPAGQNLFLKQVINELDCKTSTATFGYSVDSSKVPLTTFGGDTVDITVWGYSDTALTNLITDFKVTGLVMPLTCP